MSRRAPRRPPRHLRRAPWRAASFASLDFETTGLDYERDAIISFGAVPVEHGRVIVRDAVHQFVEPHVPASPTSMTIHEILPKDLSGAPTLREAREALRSCLDGRFLLAWYAEVEIAFLARIFGLRRREWVRRAVDVRKLALTLEGRGDETRHSLSATARRYGVPVVSPHEALDDALVTAQLFLVLATKLEDRGYRRVRDLVALTGRHTPT